MTSVRGLCSAKRPKRRLSCGVAQGFGLVEEFIRDGVLVGLGVEVGNGVERNVEKGVSEENCDSSKVPCNMR